LSAIWRRWSASMMLLSEHGSRGEREHEPEKRERRRRGLRE
jgi:hypothetical protein